MSDPALWDREYETGRWDYLLAPREQGRLAVTACYVHLFGPGAVLDVGCGAAGLYRHLDRRLVTSYTGVDLSRVALDQARRESLPAVPEAGAIPAELVEASAEAFAPARDRRFDAIVLAEVLYFVAEPLRELRRYAAMLAPRGALILSMTHKRAKRDRPDRTTEEIWQALGQASFDLLDEVLLDHPPSGNAWRIRAMRPRS